MQLKRRRRPGRSSGAGPIGASLAAATCALLGTGAPQQAVAQEIGHWKFDTAGLYYGESGGRVHDLSVNVLAKTQAQEDKYLNLGFTFDTLSGASPNGAAPSATAQTFVRPVTLTRTSGGTLQTGGGNFTVAPGDLPVDPSFKDTRFAGNLDWQQPLGRLNLIDFGGSASVEHDYTHLGFESKFARDFDHRNTTLSAGAEWSADTVKPIGGSPIPFSVLTSSALGAGTQSGPARRPKHIFDALFGVTRVLTRQMLVQVNYSIDRANGYLTDPYKILSVVDPVTGNLTPGPDPGLGLYVYENRPDSRTKKSLYGLLKRNFRGNVLGASYRVMNDDWGIHSQTFDLHFRWQLSGNKYVQPHLRLYSQSAADFYHTVLFNGQPLPAYASADYRLGRLKTVTVGLKFGKQTPGGEVDLRLEVYHQSGKPSPDALVGSLRTVNLDPNMTAVIAEISYKFGL